VSYTPFEWGFGFVLGACVAALFMAAAWSLVHSLGNGCWWLFESALDWLDSYSYRRDARRKAKQAIRSREP
jgi:hypothetical protein